MIIGIDASRAAKQIKTGTEYYSIEIIKAISQIDHKNTYKLYSQAKLPEELLILPKNFRSIVMPFTKLWSQTRLSLHLIRNKPDVLFEPAHTIPLIHPKATVVTLHDVGFKYYPQLYSGFDKFYHPWSMAYSAKHATRIITPSKDAKKDVVKFFNINSDKIDVIYHGYNKEIYFPTERKSSKLGKYLLFIGRLEEKKNITGLIKAYGLLRKEKNINHKLILIGKESYGFEKIIFEIQKLPSEIRKDVIITGYINQEEKVEYLKQADIFVLPSFFEGFGMPIIEAMACGVPVICSNVTSLPEIADKAAILVNPYKPLDIAAGLSKVINNPKLKQELIYQGLKRVKQFSWEKAGQQTLDVIFKAIKEQKGKK